MNSGKVFEKEIKDSIPNNVWFYRIKDPAASFGKSDKTRFSPKNEFDCLIYKYPILISLELKSNIGTSVSFSLEEKKMAEIKFSQIKSLRNSAEFGIKSGLLINFRKTNKTYFINILDFDRFSKDTIKKSINEKDLLNYNAVIVSQKLKRVLYTYDISFLWNEEKCGNET